MTEAIHPVLLHSCCAPCSSAILEWLTQNGYAPTVFYFNPNIFPAQEYLTRKNECQQYCRKLGIPFVDGDYDHALWREAVKGLEHEPERGLRCRACFGVRMLATAKCAQRLGIESFTYELAKGRSSAAPRRTAGSGRLLQPTLVRVRIFHGTPHHAGPGRTSFICTGFRETTRQRKKQR